MSNHLPAIAVAIVFFVVTFLILLHQELTFGMWFQIEDIHHETLALSAATFGVGVLVGSVITPTSTHKKVTSQAT